MPKTEKDCDVGEKALDSSLLSSRPCIISLCFFDFRSTISSFSFGSWTSFLNISSLIILFRQWVPILASYIALSSWTLVIHMVSMVRMHPQVFMIKQIQVQKHSTNPHPITIRRLTDPGVNKYKYGCVQKKNYLNINY